MKFHFKENRGMPADLAPVAQETLTMPIKKIGERFGTLRIADPAAEQAMLRSMLKYGQQTPVVVCRMAEGKSELLDGFKRLRAGRQLGVNELLVRTLDVGPRACKAAMLLLNRVGRPITSMEEALVVHSLCHEDGLNQVEIAALLNCHKSWVCRRLALIERLCDEAQESIRLGLLPASLGAELARLQRCNQEQLLKVIHEQRLTWRETRQVVAALLLRPKKEHESIFKNPRETVLNPEDDVSPPDERGLSLHVKQMHRRLFSLEKICQEVAHLFNTDFLLFEPHEDKLLRLASARVLVSLAPVHELLSDLTRSIKP
jgi:ParB-like chromosome segregation protein Spo0J